MNNIIRHAFLIGFGITMCVTSVSAQSAGTGGTITITPCVITAGESNCITSARWEAPTNLSTPLFSSCGYRDSGYPQDKCGGGGSGVITEQFAQSGTTQVKLNPYGARLYIQEFVSPSYTIVKDLNVAATCATGSSWNGAKCFSTTVTSTPTSGITASDCTIAPGRISCEAQVGWNVESTATSLNWCAFSGGVYMLPCNTYRESPKSLVSGSGFTTIQIPTYGVKFTVVDQAGNVLVSKNIKGVCGGGSEDKSGVCTCPTGMTAQGATCTSSSTTVSTSSSSTTGVITITPCVVAAGESSCVTSAYWEAPSTLTKPLFSSCGYRDFGYPFDKCGGGGSTVITEQYARTGTTQVKLNPYGGLFYIQEYVSPSYTIIKSVNVAATCATGSVWNGTKCFAGTASSTTQTPVICAFDVQMCSDGSYVGRNVKNNCTFNACPTTPTTTTVKACTMEARLCSNGKAMQRNPSTCEWITSSCGSSTGIGDVDPNDSQNMCVNLPSDIRKGARNDAVSDLQDFLINANYLNAEATGYFGALTFKAVQSYQGSKGFIQSGYVGPLTRAAIQKDTCGN